MIRLTRFIDPNTPLPSDKVARQWLKARIKRTQEMRFEKARRRIRADLVFRDGRCFHCGCPLVDEPGPQQAHLAIDRLSCAQHVKIVRAYARYEADCGVVLSATEGGAP